MCDSTSFALVTTIPQVYGTLLTDSAWTLNMRFRSFIWPDNLPDNLICKSSRKNYNYSFVKLSKVHDAVKNQLYCICKSYRNESFSEPLLSNLFDTEDDFHKNNRGDVILPGVDGTFVLLDVLSVDPCNASNERLVNSEIHNPLSNAANFKIKKYNEPLFVIAPITILKQIATFIQQRYEDIGLSLNISKFTKPHFCGTNFGGVDFHKSSYLCKAAFIGGGKNFIYEFVNRFPEKIHLIENCGSSYLISLQQEIETLSPNIWAKCFPSDIVELPSRSLLSLPLTFAKLQKKILKVLENLDYIVRLSLAKEKIPVFANFLIDLEDSCSSCLISQIPNIYGLLLNDHQWTTAMRLRCFLWPCSLPNDLICRCKSVVTLSHILNCKYFITYRSLVHDSVRDQLYAMCKSFNIEAFIEPLVRKLSSDQTDDSFGKRRADLVAPGIDGVLNVVDVVSVDVCKNSAARLVYSADSPLSNAEKKKIKKYEEPLAQLGRVEHVKYQFVPFAISLFGNIGPSGLHFLENFKKVLLNRSGKTMNSTFWLNRIVFCIFKSIPTMISKALLAIGVEYERNAVSRFSNSDACLEDIEF
ncbi:hypothetical protein P9112_013535 [Eukaryota sp. TZLM1-RC]